MSSDVSTLYHIVSTDVLPSTNKTIADGNVADSVTSVMATKANDSYLISTLDSTLRLMDKRDGKLLQAFRDNEVCASALRSRCWLTI